MHRDFQVDIRSRGIGGDIHYSSELGEYLIPFEVSGDYREGYLVFMKSIDSEIDSPDPKRVRSQVRMHLQDWAKKTGAKLTFI